MSGILLTSIVRKGETMHNVHRGSSNRDLQDYAEKIINKLDLTENYKKSYEIKSYCLSYAVQEQACVFVGTDISFSRNRTFGFITKMFEELAKSKRGTVKEDTVRQQMQFFSTDPSVDRLSEVQSQIDEVKNIMLINIDKILERGEKIEAIDAVAADLVQQANTFKHVSSDLKCALIRNNIKLTIIIIVLYLVIIGVIILVVVLAVKLH